MSEDAPSEDLAVLYANAPCGYNVLSPDARIGRVNRTLTGWLGSSAVARGGQPFHTLLSFGGRIAFETHLAPLLRLQGFVAELALALLHHDGSKIPVIANASENRGRDGQR